MLLDMFVVASMLGSYHLETQLGVGGGQRVRGREGGGHSRSDRRHDIEVSRRAF